MPDRKHHILIVDADPSVEEALRPILDGYAIGAQAAATIDTGYQAVISHPPSLLLVGITLEDGPGLKLFEMVRKRSRSSHIPIMFVAGYNEGKMQKEILQAGVDDFVTRPFDADLVALRIRNAILRTERDGLTHPRTGLPTGRLLRERIRTLADEFGWYKVDFTINNFDAFVSRYGFMAAEEVVIFAAGLVDEVIKEAGTAEDFLGQRDDNTFVVITTLAHGPALSALLEQRFNADVQAFYTFMEREQGFIEVEEGGDFVQKPLMSAAIKHQEGEPDDGENAR
jgi:CheY-like chemotaxis protein